MFDFSFFVKLISVKIKYFLIKFNHSKDGDILIHHK